MVSTASKLVSRISIFWMALAIGVAGGISGAAHAADLDPYAYKGDSRSPYNDKDSRYAELYGPDDEQDVRRPRNKDYGRRTHVEYDIFRGPRPRYVDRRYGYDRHARNDRPYRDYGRQQHGRFALAPHCVPRRLVMRRLFRDGWHEFHGLELRGPKARVRARSDDGRLFALTIDRCSGEIVSARQVEYRHTNGYHDRRAYNESPRRYYSYK